MKRIIYSLLLLFCSVNLMTAQEKTEGIRFFEGTFEEALELAKKENKLIFMDCYGSWCGGCVQMEKKVFPLKEVGDFFNANFICLSRNMDRHPESKELNKRYNIAGYPTWLFLNEQGYVVLMDAGFKEAPKFIELAQKALNAPRVGAEQRFDEGERDEDFVKNYIKELLQFAQADRVDRVLFKLYEEKGGKILNDADYWHAFEVCTVDPDAPISLYVAHNWKKLAKRYGKEIVLQKIRNQYVSWSAYLKLTNGSGNYNTGKLDQEKLDAYLQKMGERQLPNGEMLQQEMRFLALLQQNKDQEALELGERVLKNADAQTLMNWSVFAEKRFEGKELRSKAATWAQRAWDMMPADNVFKTECGNVLKDLQESERPKFGVIRVSMPTRGYENGGFVKGKK